MHLTLLVAAGEVVFFIPGNSGNIKALGITDTSFSISVDHIIRSAFIILLKNRHMYNILPDISLLSHFYYFHQPPLGEYNYIIQIGTIQYKLIFL